MNIYNCDDFNTDLPDNKIDAEIKLYQISNAVTNCSENDNDKDKIINNVYQPYIENFIEKYDMLPDLSLIASDDDDETCKNLFNDNMNPQFVPKNRKAQNDKLEIYDSLKSNYPNCETYINTAKQKYEQNLNTVLNELEKNGIEMETLSDNIENENENVTANTDLTIPDYERTFSTNTDPSLTDPEQMYNIPDYERTFSTNTDPSLTDPEQMYNSNYESTISTITDPSLTDPEPRPNQTTLKIQEGDYNSNLKRLDLSLFIPKDTQLIVQNFAQNTAQETIQNMGSNFSSI